MYQPRSPEANNRKCPSTFNDDEARKKQAVLSPICDTDDDVCDRCKAVPWNEFASPVRRQRVMVIQQSHEELKASSCRICRLLSSIKPALFDEQPCSLVANRLIDSNILYITELTKIYGGAPTLHGALRLSQLDQHRDLGMEPIGQSATWPAKLQEHVTTCLRSHSLDCEQHMYLSPPSVVSVIDCKDPEHTVVPAPPNCRYTALSYVWGNPFNVPKTKYSQVVHDAIEVTLLMGLQYLWVDRHCINQDDKDEKLYQISQMGSIYAYAEITIIAAAGKDSSYGLPGISRPLQQQNWTTVGDVVLTQLFPCSSSRLKRSAWAGRAWTFQECFMSPRRLIFTDPGVTYLCSRIYRVEGDYSVPEKSVRGFSRLAEDSVRGFAGLMPGPDRTSTLPSIEWANRSLRVIAEYTKRRLTYDTDALRAILGILQMLERFDICCIWGIIVPAPDPEPYSPGLHWVHSSTARRRPGFPSWSYIGWEGPIHTEPLFPYEKSCTIWIGDRDKPHFPATGESSVIESLKGLGENVPRYLHIESPVISIPLEYIRWTSEQKSHETIVRYRGRTLVLRGILPDGVYANFMTSTGFRVMVEVHLDNPSSYPSCAVGIPFTKTILLGDLVSFWLNDAIFGREIWMLLLEDRGGYFERIGMIWMKCGDYGTSYDQNCCPGSTIFMANSGELLKEVTLDNDELMGAEKKTVVIG